MADIKISELLVASQIKDNDVFVIDEVTTAGGIVTKQISYSLIVEDILGDPIFNGQAFFDDGTEIAPGIAYNNQRNTGFYRKPDSQIGITCAGNTVLLASNVTDQRVGINTGTIEPASTLEVGGDITLTYNTGSFVIGQVTDHYAITISNTDLFGIGGDSYVYVNKDGGLANKDKDFGALGDVLTSGAGDSFSWVTQGEIISGNIDALVDAIIDLLEKYPPTPGDPNGDLVQALIDFIKEIIDGGEITDNIIQIIVDLLEEYPGDTNDLVEALLDFINNIISGGVGYVDMISDQSPIKGEKGFNNIVLVNDGTNKPNFIFSALDTLP